MAREGDNIMECQKCQREIDPNQSVELELSESDSVIPLLLLWGHKICLECAQKMWKEAK